MNTPNDAIAAGARDSTSGSPAIQKRVRRPRELLWVVLASLASHGLIVLAVAPALGPPFKKAIVEAAFRLLIGVIITVPLIAVLLTGIAMFLPRFGVRTICLGWLMLMAVLAAVSWTSISPVGDFQRETGVRDLRSLRVLDREQWTSFNDGSTWVFRAELSPEDRQRIIETRKLKWVDPKDAEYWSPSEPAHTFGSWLSGWRAYQRPVRAVQHFNDELLMVSDEESNVVFVLHRQILPPRQR
jgi:hypothetical protein